MRVWKYTTHWALLAALSASLASAQETQREREARAWFEHHWPQPNDVWVENVRFDLVEEHHEALTATELARMRREVSGHPDHPDRLHLQTAERRLAHGPDTSTWVIWLGEQGRLRCSETRSTGGQWDVAITPTLTWAMAPGTITAIDPRDGYPAERNYGPHEQQSMYRIAGFLRGAFSIRAGSLPLTLSEFTLRGSTWQARVENEEYGFGLLLEGDWDDVNQTGRALTASVVECRPDPAEVGKRWEFLDWRDDPVLHAPVASRSVEYQSDGRSLCRVARLVGVAPISRNELREVLRMPSLDSQRDAYRGELSLASLYDYRGGGEAQITLRDLEKGGEVTLSESELPQRKEERWLRYAGWIAGIGVVCIVVIGAILRHSARGA